MSYVAPGRTPMKHVYEPLKPHLKVAKATNKCNCCGRGIPKNDIYIQVVLIDKCRHYINRRKIGMHETVKLCRGCTPALLQIPKISGVYIREEFLAEARRLVKEESVRRKTRYDIAIGYDLTEKFVETFKGHIRKRALTGENA